MYGQPENTFAPRIFLLLCHGILVAVAGWILVGHAAPILWSGMQSTKSPVGRRVIVLAAASIYFIRVWFTALFFLRRRMGWREAITIVVWVGIIHVGFAVLTLSTQQPLDSLDLTAGALYLLGSYLNTGSELERYKWKQRPENRGRLYTEGLFRYSMHINYFGDTLLFTGYALLTRHLLAFIVPSLMVAIFVFGNIPMLDRYLHERYGEEFSDYARETKKFIPFVY